MDDYQVTRQHYGDKQYYEGETRKLNAIDAKLLIAAGLVSDAAPVDPAEAKKAAAAEAKKAAAAEKAAAAAAEKMAQDHANKMAPDVSNKAE